jgi:hypothetical protein
MKPLVLPNKWSPHRARGSTPHAIYIRRAVMSVIVLLLPTGCAESPTRAPFESGSYSFDGTPVVHTQDIASITLEPVPEGPTSPVFVRHAQAVADDQLVWRLRELLPFVPDPLPATLDQGECELGGDLVVTTKDGGTIAYGPCRRPQSINSLWAHFLDITSDGACRPSCGPAGKAGP